MTLWRLEWLRLTRTHRLVALLAVNAFFGLTGPLTARYLADILAAIGTDGIVVELPDPTPADGIAQFVGNISQIGVVVVVLIAASALAFDGRREMAVFLRTRVTSVRSIVLPAYGVTTAGAIAGLVLGTACAWYETTVVLGAPPVGAMLMGTAYGAASLAFTVALVGFVAAIVRAAVATAGITLVALLLLAGVGGIFQVNTWLPAGLLGALGDLTAGRAATDYLPGLAMTLGLTALALTGTVLLGNRREQ